MFQCFQNMVNTEKNHFLPTTVPVTVCMFPRVDDMIPVEVAMGLPGMLPTEIMLPTACTIPCVTMCPVPPDIVHCGTQPSTDTCSPTEMALLILDYHQMYALPVGLILHLSVQR